MTLKQAIKKIVKNWEEIKKAQTPDVIGYSTPATVAVWVAESDKSQPYEVDTEWIGVTKDGNLVWAYASGCSCWEGDYTEETKPTIKEFTLNHNHLPEEWEKAIVEFAETNKIKQL